MEAGQIGPGSQQENVASVHSTGRESETSFPGGPELAAESGAASSPSYFPKHVVELVLTEYCVGPYTCPLAILRLFGAVSAEVEF